MYSYKNGKQHIKKKECLVKFNSAKVLEPMKDEGILLNDYHKQV